jgi:hypothetical protein
MEPTTGIEPVNLFLTKEALYLLSYVGLRFTELMRAEFGCICRKQVERETRLELATFSLEG